MTKLSQLNRQYESLTHTMADEPEWKVFRLRHMADQCEVEHPDKARMYRKEALAVEADYGLKKV